MHGAQDRNGRSRLARVCRERLPGDVDGVDAAGWLRGDPRGIALSGDWLGGATVLTSHPLMSALPGDNPFGTLDRLPFVLEPPSRTSGAAAGGGWFGWLGFGLARIAEPVPPPPPRPIGLPLFDLAFHDHVVIREPDGTWWFEALWTDTRAELLEERLACWRTRLTGAPPATQGFAAGTLRPVGAGLAGHRAAVAEAIERIAEGEFSQANLCLRLEAEFAGDALDLWRAATASGRPAYSAYVAPNASGHAVVSLSPELFLKRTGRQVLSRPIKGTAPIASDPAALLASGKDRAENVMIVDLMRNDLGRVCGYGSVAVGELCALREAPGVWQLESEVHGELRPGVSDEQLLRATFPPGSVTGAPKVQALRTIHNLEATAREAYCGAVGMCSPLAGLELNVAIRTLELARERVWLGVGGGIVSDSSPDAEVAEALTKARGTASAAGLAIADVDVTVPQRRIRLSAVERPDPAAGVFETILTSGGRAVHLCDHMARLSASCSELGLRLPDPEAEITAAAARLKDGALRITVEPGGTFVETRPLPRPRIMELMPVLVPGGLGAHKWADRRLIDRLSGPSRTPLICDSDGSLLEAGYAAVLVISDGSLIAPPLDGRSLPSVSRRHVMDAARRTGWDVVVRDIALAEAPGADAIVLTSSLRGPHLGKLADRPPPPQAAELCQALVLAMPDDAPASAGTPAMGG